MQHIETVVVGSGGAASITFMAVGDIPSEYTDLVLLVSGRMVADGVALVISFNTGGTYSRRRLLGNGSSASSDTIANDGLVNFSSATASTFANTSFYIPNYRSSVAKSYSVDTVTENNATLSFQAIYAGLWTGTDPITSIVLSCGGSSFVEHSSASLYGITAGSDGIVAVS